MTKSLQRLNLMVMLNKLAFDHNCLLVSHNGNEIQLIWSGTTADVSAMQGLVIENSG